MAGAGSLRRGRQSAVEAIEPLDVVRGVVAGVHVIEGVRQRGAGRGAGNQQPYGGGNGPEFTRAAHLGSS